MNFETFKRLHRIYFENVKFNDVSESYRIGEKLEYNQFLCFNGAKIGKLSDNVLQLVYDDLHNNPLTAFHYLAIGNFKFLLDSIIGPDTFHPFGVYNASRYLLPQELTDAQYISLSPFMKITTHGPNLLLERYSKIPIRRRSVCTN
jgi:hypothetical protein